MNKQDEKGYILSTQEEIDGLKGVIIHLQEQLGHTLPSVHPYIQKLKELKQQRIEEVVKDEDNYNLLSLLIEIDTRMDTMMRYCERLQPVKLDTERNDEQFEYNGDYYTENDTPITVDITDEEEFIKGHKLFRLLDPELDELLIVDDQTSRSLLQELGGVIKSLEK
jgi:hypothetical protein